MASVFFATALQIPLPPAVAGSLRLVPSYSAFSLTRQEWIDALQLLQKMSKLFSKYDECGKFKSTALYTHDKGVSPGLVERPDQGRKRALEFSLSVLLSCHLSAWSTWFEFYKRSALLWCKSLSNGYQDIPLITAYIRATGKFKQPTELRIYVQISWKNNVCVWIINVPNIRSNLKCWAIVVVYQRILEFWKSRHTVNMHAPELHERIWFNTMYCNVYIYSW